MKSYIAYFKLKFVTGLQYRAAALAGIGTQVFFGFIYTSIYIAFYRSDNTNIPMPLNDLITYLWLYQSFFSLVYLWYKDNEIINLIKSGNISYELCRPQDLYFMWFFKILGERLANVAIRFLPVILVALILPEPYNMDLSITIPRLIVFSISFFFATILMVTIVLLYHVICLYTLDEKGIVNIFMIISDVLSGLVIPIPFFPDYLKSVCNILPFRYTGDFIFRFYVGNISMYEGYISIVIQIIWILIIFIISKLLLNNALKKVVVQGG